MRRGIANQILIARFQADLRRYIRKFIHVLHREMPPTRLLGNLRHKPGPDKFLGGSSATSHGFKDPHGLDLQIRLPHYFAHFARCIPARVVSSIRKDQNRVARVAALFDLVRAVAGFSLRGALPGARLDGDTGGPTHRQQPAEHASFDRLDFGRSYSFHATNLFSATSQSVKKCRRGPDWLV